MPSVPQTLHQSSLDHWGQTECNGARLTSVLCLDAWPAGLFTWFEAFGRHGNNSCASLKPLEHPLVLVSLQKMHLHAGPHCKKSTHDDLAVQEQHGRPCVTNCSRAIFPSSCSPWQPCLFTNRAPWQTGPLSVEPADAINQNSRAKTSPKLFLEPLHC